MIRLMKLRSAVIDANEILGIFPLVPETEDAKAEIRFRNGSKIKTGLSIEEVEERWRKALGQPPDGDPYRSEPR